MVWTYLPFGKHCGKTLPQVLFRDPEWFFWAYNQGVLHDRGAALAAQAEEIHARASHVKVRPVDGEPCEVEYFTHPQKGKLLRVQVVRKSEPHHTGGTPASRMPYFDLSLAFCLGRYEKAGSKMLVDVMKYNVLGPQRPMTQARCEAFFDDDDNFDLDWPD